MQVFNAAIVGGGSACVAIMDMINTGLHPQLRMNIVGVADIDPEAPGIKRARQLNIFTTTDYHDFFAIESLNLVLELTGVSEISIAIQKDKPAQVQFMDHTVSRLFWDITQLGEEKLIPESEVQKKIKAVSQLFMDVIDLEEERLNAEREAEERIKAERDNTAKILNSLAQAVVVVDKDYMIENANETFLNDFGREDENVIGRTCLEVVFRRYGIPSTSFRRLVASTMDTRMTNREEFQFDKEGKKVYAESVYIPIRDDKGEYTRCLVSISDITHRKGLELDLVKSRKKYKNLFQDARDGIVLFDKQGKTQETNVSLSRMLGFTREELEHMRVADLAEKTSAKILSDHLGALEIMGFVSVELEFIKKDGDPLPVEANISWLPEEKIFQIMARDISVRKKLDESRKLYSEKLEKEVQERTKELRASQQETLKQKKYAEGIIYGSPIPMFVLDGAHKITYWNKAMGNLTQNRGEEMEGTDRHWKPFYPHKRPMMADLIIENDIETIHKLYDGMHLRKSSMVDGAYEAEHYFEHLGKEGTHLYFNAAPIKDDQGAVQGAIVTYQDFSERVKMTQEIRRREAFVQNLIQNSIDGIIATDKEGRIAVFNQGAMDILGYDQSEIAGKKSYQEILLKETAKEIRNAFYGDQHGPKSKIINMEVELLNKDEEPIPIRLSGTLLFEKGKEVGSVVFIQDLREIHRLQREKGQAERMAAIGQAVAGLAHYIKNILNGLKGGEYVINSAMKKKDMDLVANGWRIVEKNIDQISTIVMDMLVYSKERKPNYQSVDPNELVMDVLELMKERSERAGVTLTPELMPGLKEVALDRTAIHRCLLNLISNAIDACTLEGIMSGNGQVKVKTSVPEGWALGFEVTDNGMGMDQKIQDKIFTGFFSTKGYQGTGLGLPVTQKIVKEHNGKLAFESEPGKGTTFTLLLPGVSTE